MEGLLGLLLPAGWLAARGCAGRVGCVLAVVEAVVVRSSGEGLLELLASWALQMVRNVQGAGGVRVRTDRSCNELCYWSN